MRRGVQTMALDPTTGRLCLATADCGPPAAATPEQPEPRAQPLPDSFTVLVAARR
jgi:hypothetical protein